MLASLSRPRPAQRSKPWSQSSFDVPPSGKRGIRDGMKSDGDYSSPLTQSTLTFQRSEGSMVSRSSASSLQATFCGYSDEFPVSGEVGAHLFTKLKLVGRGGVGKVYLAHLRDSDPVKVYAVKEMDKADMIERNKVKRVMTEREIFASTNHPFIISMYASFQTKDKLYFVMDYAAGGEFFKVLQSRRNKRLSEDAAKFYAAEVVLALEYLHSMGFLYRDLKPENVMMRGDGHLALTDFDLSKLAVPVKPKVVKKRHSVGEVGLGLNLKRRESSKCQLQKLDIVGCAPVLEGEANSFVGTAEYLAPEVLNRKPQTAAVDWWTLGILIYEMLCGCTPFVGKDQDETFERINNGDLKFPPNVLISKECKSLLKGLLARDPNKRLGHSTGATAVKAHPWFKTINFGLIREMEAPVKPQVSDPTDLSQYKPMKNPNFGKNDSELDSADDTFSNFSLVANERTKY
mmetsp:Transcript_15400/g.33140  ORF Transcript_15400/g.33140 Transcript_15400/m.33140 type:complete len:459 (-) Transcript_15400:27-1403(-)